MTNPADDACLIRPYLGRRRRAQQKKKLNPSRFQPFTLRNVPLHLDVLEDLGGQYIRAYAQTMAEALALLHWGAGIDANDVEFVLAPPRDKPVAFLPSWKFPIPGSESGYFESRFLGTHCMWILDFDCCRRMSMDDAGVEQACTAFYKNDPPYPRPGTGDPADEEPWAVFKSRFLEASRKIWGEREGSVELGLAEKLMRRIEEEGAARREKREALRSLPN